MQRIALIVAFIMSVFIIQQPFTAVMAERTAAATDIRGHWAEKEIQRVVALGIMETDGEGRFHPEKTVASRSCVEILVKLRRYLSEGGVSAVQNAGGQKSFLQEAYDKGIVKEENAALFEGKIPVNRMELAYRAARFLDLRPSDEPLTFADEQWIHSHRGLVQAAVREGIVSGYPDNTFQPYRVVSRGELAVVLNRIITVALNDPLLLVNKQHPLPAGFVPESLVEPNVPFPFKEKLPKRKMRKVAADALENLFAAASKEGLKLYAVSGYRSYERQDAIFAYNAGRYGEEKANRVSAHPGESEHQTGLAMDISCESVGFGLIQAFGETPEGKWVQAHAHEYGFIIRYPKGKEALTGYEYEPWHLRYVGVEAASEMYAQGLVLEEYLQQLN